MTEIQNSKHVNRFELFDIVIWCLCIGSYIKYKEITIKTLKANP